VAAQPLRLRHPRMRRRTSADCNRLRFWLGLRRVMRGGARAPPPLRRQQWGWRMNGALSNQFRLGFVSDGLSHDSGDHKAAHRLPARAQATRNRMKKGCFFPPSVRMQPLRETGRSTVPSGPPPRLGRRTAPGYRARPGTERALPHPVKRAGA